MYFMSISKICVLKFRFFLCTQKVLIYFAALSWKFRCNHKVFTDIRTSRSPFWIKYEEQIYFATEQILRPSTYYERRRKRRSISGSTRKVYTEPFERKLNLPGEYECRHLVQNISDIRRLLSQMKHTEQGIDRQTDTTYSLCVHFIRFGKITHDTRSSFTFWQTFPTLLYTDLKVPLYLCLKCANAKCCSLLLGNICLYLLSVEMSCVASVSEEIIASLFRFDIIVKLAHVFSCALRCPIWRQLCPSKCGHIHLPNGTKSRTQD
jgi:hypothetical protein